MSNIKIGLLNFGSLDSDKPHYKAIEELIEYVELADISGFTRFWLTEHYLYKQNQIWANPEMLVPILAIATERIKIGLAGSLISIHRPFDVANNFKMLANLFSGRIDLGLAKGGALEIGHQGDPDLSLLTGLKPDEIFERNTRMVADFFRNEEQNYHNGLVIPPLFGEIPDLWLLGSSYRSLDFALENRANFSRSLFHKNGRHEADTEILKKYKENFHTAFNIYPQTSLAVAGACHEDQHYADKITESRLNSGYSAMDRKGVFSGSPAKIYDELHLLQELYQIDEFVILQLYENHSDRMKGIELLAREFNF
jgi:alkanesulfonate monooxygenase SsuD/methylene tetrahydromethanopterin reductase-like flavin-dependent oxidoreductase (luciferase family)